jgi:hypothetical protein
VVGYGLDVAVRDAEAISGCPFAIVPERLEGLIKENEKNVSRTISVQKCGCICTF